MSSESAPAPLSTSSFTTRTLRTYRCLRRTAMHFSRSVKPISASSRRSASSGALRCGGGGSGQKASRARSTKPRACSKKSKGPLAGAAFCAASACGGSPAIALPLALAPSDPKCWRKVGQSMRAPGSVRPTRSANTSRTAWSSRRCSAPSSWRRSCWLIRPSRSLSASSKTRRRACSQAALPRSMHAATNSVQQTVPSRLRSIASAASSARALAIPSRFKAASS
mmetsp:Transcript_30361/g.95760  ORF Transcript_30361/g.95760 Transcript_30361/m.95760 type:complete len:224 (+) Transcript_30361:18-689(+)